MADETPGRVAATLAEIRRRSDYADRYAEFGEIRDSANDVPRLLAAVEAALKLADELDAEAAGSLLEEINEVQRDCAAKIREAIGAALTGTETTDA